MLPLQVECLLPSRAVGRNHNCHGDLFILLQNDLGKLTILPSSPTKPQHVTFPELVQVQSHLFGFAHQLPNPFSTLNHHQETSRARNQHPLNNPALQFTKSWMASTPSAGLFILVSGWTDADPDLLATSPTFTFEDSSWNLVAYLDDIATHMASSYKGELVQVTSERGGESFIPGASRLLMLQTKPMLAVPTHSGIGGKLKRVTERVYASRHAGSLVSPPTPTVDPGPIVTRELLMCIRITN